MVSTTHTEQLLKDLVAAVNDLNQRLARVEQRPSGGPNLGTVSLAAGELSRLADEVNTNTRELRKIR